MQTQHSDGIRKLVIGAPLLVIVMFCFGFLMAHPGGSGADKSSAANNVSNKQASSASASPDITPASHLSQTDSSQSSSTSSTSSSSDPGNTSDSNNEQSAPQAGSAPSKSGAKAKANGKRAGNNPGGLLQTAVNSVFNGN